MEFALDDRARRPGRWCRACSGAGRRRRCSWGRDGCTEAGAGGKFRALGRPARRPYKAAIRRRGPMRTAEITRKTAETEISVSDRPRRHRQLPDGDRRRVLRPYARPAGAAFADRHGGPRRGRPAYRRSPHRRGLRHRAGPGADPGAGRQARHPPLWRMPSGDGRHPGARGARPVGAALAGLGHGVDRAEDRQLRHRTGARVLPGALDPWRHHPACRPDPRREQPPYRRGRRSRRWPVPCAWRSSPTRGRPASVPSTKGML